MNDSLLKQPIAIIGMASRLPGADNLGEYWELLAAGRDAVSDMPPDRLDRELYFTSEKGIRGKTYSVRGGLIPDRPLDSQRAGLSDEDLKNSDPAHQIMCEVAADALRHARLDPFRLPQWRTGVYIGHSGGSPLGGDLAYGTLAEETVDYLRDAAEFAQLPGDVQDAVIREVVTQLRSRRRHRDASGMPETGAHAVAGLVAQVLRLSGPQMAIDAACASSLVALALGAIALQQNEIDAAIVGGASFNKCDSLILFSHAQSCSASGSRPFDEGADGLISAEGYVALVVKTLDRALADGDPIHAVIRGIGLSSDGRGRSLWAPRKEGQVQAMRRAYGPGIDPQRVGYVEAHATSTQVGDATEVEALREFFDSVASGRKIPIGSVKSNIGHTLETAGLAGLVKSVLAMQQGIVPPSINVRQLNREIPWPQLPFFVAREALAWPREQQSPPRRAAVNAFGIGGLNVHVVVDEYDPKWDYAKDSKTHCSVQQENDAIAIIGRGVILPGASSAAELKQLATSGASQITDAPPKRWRKRIGVRPGIAKSGQSPNCRGGYINGYEYDWRKFKIPPKQIDQANPLQFMLLDAARQALEEAGYGAKDFDHVRTAVVVGSAFGAEFGNQLQVGLRLPEMKRDVVNALVARGVAREQAQRTAERTADLLLASKPALLDETGSFTASTLASRISKTLDLMGGAMAIDTNDCSALSALDAACGLLRSGACSMVLCAGASRAMDLASFELLALRNWLAGGEGSANPITGRHTPGEGVAMVLLKPLSAAQRDGDKILGIIRNVEARNLRVRPHQATNVYADPLEKQVGHTQAAQGLVSLVSAVTTQTTGEWTVRSVTDQGVEYCADVVVGAQLPPKKEPFVVVEQSKGETSDVGPTFSSNGDRSPSQPRLIRLGAGSLDQLVVRIAEARQDVQRWFNQPSSFAASDAARLAIVAADETSLATKLELAIQQVATPAARAALEEQGIYVQTKVDPLRRIAFLFPGQGSQYPDMLRGLADVSPAAQATLREADAALRRMTGESFAALAWGKAAALGNDVWATQAAMLVADVMLAAALEERGIAPHVVCGHSFGEFAALVAAGSWSLEQALQVTRIRSAAIDASRTGRGGLLSIDAPAARVAALIEQHRCRVYLTHDNAPQQAVVGGDDRALVEFAALLTAEGLTSRSLPVPSPYHTPLLADTQQPLQAAVAAQTLLPPAVPLLSSVTNRYAAEPEEIRANLVTQMVEPVRWRQLVQRLLADGVTVFVEAGPQQVLTRLGRQIVNGTPHLALAPADHPKRSAEEMLLRVQAALETAGIMIGNTQGIPAASSQQEAMFEIEHFDATARRRERRRSGSTHTVSAPAVEKKPASVEQFDATSARREARRGSHSIAQTSMEASRPLAVSQVTPTSTPVVPPANNVAPPQLERFLIDFVVEQTGYPAEMIDLDWDMEADLGIDSIKRAQLFGELREFFHFEQPGKGGLSLDQFRTLRQVLSFLEQTPDTSGRSWQTAEPAAAPAAVAHSAAMGEAPRNGHAAAQKRSSAELEHFLISFVVDQTGYPPEIVELDGDLEADLGIDSIKKAQLFGELREHFMLPLEQMSRLKMSEYRTLRQVLGVLESLQPMSSEPDANVSEPEASVPGVFAKQPPTPAPVSAPAQARSSAELEQFLINFVVDQTGYPPEIVELDADLEADLGIDSIKKAQLFGELREHFTLPLEQMSRLKMSEYRTLRQVLAVLESLQSAGKPEASAPAVSLPSTPASAPTPAFARGLQLGSAQATEMHTWLRDRADTAWSPESASRLTSVATHTEEAWDELRGIAEAAGLHVSNVIAYRQHANGNGGGHGNGNGNGHSNGNGNGRHHKASDSDDWSPLADLIDAEPKIASRYVLRTAPAPQKPGSPAQPAWRGGAVILGDNPYARAIKARFERDGRRAHLIAPSSDPLAAAEELERIWQQGPLPHLFITTPRDADAVTSLDAAAWQRRSSVGLMTPFWLCQRWMRLTTAAGLMDQASIAATVSLGGDFGLSGNVVAAESGAICGLLKAIIIESWVNGHRTLPVKMIDSPATTSSDELVDALWRELAVPSYDCEIAWLGGQRNVVRAIKTSAPSAAVPTTNPIRRGGVWVCTGGARGITAYVVKELALRMGVKLHLLGTAPVPNIPDSWRNLNDEGLKSLKLQVMQGARAAGRNPVKEWQNTEKALEIDSTVREFAAEGISATYHSVDVADRAALGRVLDRIRATDGPIEGILHGAGVGKDSRFDRKDPDKVRQCFQAKIDGALALMDLTRRDPIKHFIGFGSISGRFGANGHTDYSAANDMLCKLVDWYRTQRPEVNAVAFHWHAWGDVGMATKPETRLALEMVDMQFMPAREGLAHLFRELAAGTPEGEVLITDDRYHRMFYPAETLSGAEDGKLKLPLLDEGRAAGQTVELDLDPLVEPFLIEHRLEDRPLLPVVIGTELLAEATLKQAGSGRVVALHNVEALNGLKFFNDRSQTVKIAAAASGNGRYRCELTADFLSRDGKLIEPNRGYLRGEVEIATGTPQLQAQAPPLDDCDWQPIEYAERGSKFYLGTMLRACKQIRTAQGVLWGKIYPPMLQELAGRRRSADGWIVPSAALDACLYATGLLAWMQVQAGPSLPFRFGKIALGRLPHPGEACLVECKFLRREGRYADFNFTLFGSAGDVILQVEDYRIVYLA